MRRVLINIRLATADDAVSLSALAIHVFLDTYATDGIRPDIAREALGNYSAEVFLTRLTASEGIEFYIAEANGHLVGFAEISHYAIPPVDDMPSGIEIIKLYIQPSFHKQGIGKALLRVVEQRTCELELPLVWLTAWAGNLNALGFYDHCGFVDVGRVDYEIEGKVYDNRVLCKQLI